MFNEKGLYPKYQVTKKEDGSAVEGCFVLRPQEDTAARRALLTYAATTKDKVLADDIRNWVAGLESEQTAANLCFYIQTGAQGEMTSDAAAFAAACDEANWLAETSGGDRFNWTVDAKVAAMMAAMDGIEHVIPIGSVEFVQNFLTANNLPPLHAMNIPPELRLPEYLRREIWDGLTKTEALRLSEKRRERLFLKPALAPKLFEATTTNFPEGIPIDQPLFVSRLLDGEQAICAEWRVFVYRNRILNIRPYALDENWVFPDRGLVNDMVSDICHPACTLDVAVLENGETVLLEAQPFIACGLYGFEGADLVKMARAAWKEHLQKR